MANMVVNLLFIYYFTWFIEAAYSESNTLVQGQQLKDGQYLASASGNYKLGFFSGSGRKRYVGIWHNQAGAENARTDSRKAEKPVWVANRDTPVMDNSGILTISNDGHLKILHNGGEDIVSLSVPLVNDSNTSATLLDSGDFVIYVPNSDGSIKQDLWHSFDYPSDTLLPGMKLGINTKTGHKWSLTSWSRDDDPAPGYFTLGMNLNNTNQLIIWLQGKIYWVSGLWQNSNFNLPHVLSNDEYYHFSYHSDEKEKYFTYFVYEDVISFQRLTLKEPGALFGMAMDTEKEILSCWGSSFTIGCFGKTSNSSRCYHGEGFTAGKGIMHQNGIKFSEWSEWNKLTLNACEGLCKDYCFCGAYASTNDDETGCELWDRGGTYFVEHDSDASRYIYLRNSTFDFKSKEESQVLTLRIGIIVAAIGGLCMLPLLYYFAWRKYRAKAKPLIRITITMIGGLIVRMFRSIRYMIQENLGYCDPAKKNILDWKKRFNIIQGILQGFLYLHNYSRLRIIHRDLKASNILLDDEMNPKISDFGMARIFGSNDSKVNTDRVVGTYGYMPPEYVMEGVFSTKSDVFSFGVLLLEIVSGKKNYNSYHSERPLNLIGYAWELWGEGRGLELIDPTLGDLDHSDQVLRCIHVGLLCVQERPVDKPAMLDVIFMIYNEANKLPAPKQPAFFLRRNMPEAGIVECRPENCLSNGVSISEMVPR